MESGESVPTTVQTILSNGTEISYTLSEGDRPAGGRQCGTCSLCCRLLPVLDLKVGFTKCPHSRHHAGGCCKIHATKPRACELWSCRWLVDPECNLPRPDRAHYVIDVLPDEIEATDRDGNKQTVPVIQVWIDPAWPEAHREPRLRAWLAEQASQTGMAAIVRSGKPDSLVLAAPALTSTRTWIESTATVGPGVGLWNAHG